jgi:oligopeptide transport system ATP-binding protein
VEFGENDVSSLIRLDDLKKYFPIESGFIQKSRVDLKAVDGVSFSIEEGDTFGLVGESGCGKTTIGKLLLKLYEPTAGRIFFKDRDVTRLEGTGLDDYRENIQAVFQNPYASLNPRMRIWKLIGEPLIIKGWKKKAVLEKVAELLALVGLPADCGSRFPHEMSAGQRQQIAIARALSINPRFIVLDEPTSLLDVSAQASILNMIVELQKKLDLTYLFISHNLAVVRFLSSRVAVMYCGKLVELGASRKLYTTPKHPYTQALLSSVLDPDPEAAEEGIVLEGDVMSPINPPPGCRFLSRCRDRSEACRTVEPPLVEIEPDYFVACHLRQAR